MSSVARVLAGLAVVAVLLGTAWFTMGVDRPYGDVLGDRISLVYTGATMKAWGESSPDDHAWHWQLHHDPEFPGVSRPYVNHPPGVLPWTWAADRLVGGGWRAWRAGAACWWALAAFALLIWMRWGSETVAGRGTRAWMVILFVTCGPLVQNGDLLCPPISGLVPSLVCLLAWASWRATGRSSQGVLACLALLVALLCDWNAWLLLPALCGDLILGGGGASASARSRMMTALGGAAALAGVLLLDHAWWAVGGPTALAEQIADVRAVVEAPPSGRVALMALGESFVDGFGWPLLTLAAAGLVLGLAGMERGPVLRVAVTGIVAAGLALWLFRSRTHDHRFWVVVAAPGLAAASALGAAVLLRSAARWGGRGGVWIVLVLLLLVPADGARRGMQAEAAAENGRDRLWAAEIDKAFGPRDLVCALDYSSASMRVHAKTTIWPQVDDRAAFDEVLRRYGPERLEALDRLVMLVPGGLARAASDPGLAWLRALPRVPGSARDLPAPMPLGVFVVDRARLSP